MGIDFHDPANARTYSGREADPGWGEAVLRLVDPRGLRVVDVGCGGGTYARAWLRLGAAQVLGVDASAPILEAARSDAPPGLELRLGDAAATGLLSGSADVVFARALVHHVADLGAVVRETYRLLVPGGRYLVQDRTMADVDELAGPDHVRGYLLEALPRLRDVEARRRPDPGVVEDALRANGFEDVTRTTLRETRRTYPDREGYLAEVRTRTGRSILHELDDAELARLLDVLRARLTDGPVVERDRWTLWSARRPGGDPTGGG